MKSGNSSPTTEADVVDWLNVERLVDKWNITSKTIDRTSRRIFPACFLAFNVVYWLIYTLCAVETDITETA